MKPTLFLLIVCICPWFLFAAKQGIQHVCISIIGNFRTSQAQKRSQPAAAHKKSRQICQIAFYSRIARSILWNDMPAGSFTAFIGFKSDIECFFAVGKFIIVVKPGTEVYRNEFPMRGSSYEALKVHDFVHGADGTDICLQESEIYIVSTGVLSAWKNVIEVFLPGAYDNRAGKV